MYYNNVKYCADSNGVYLVGGKGHFIREEAL